MSKELYKSESESESDQQSAEKESRNPVIPTRATFQNEATAQYLPLDTMKNFTS